MKRRSILVEFTNNNIFIIGIVSLLLMVGIVSGSFSVRALDTFQRTEVIQLLEGFLNNTDVYLQDNLATFRTSIIFNIQTIIILWFFGLFSFGSPFIGLLLFARGFILGFAVAFLIEELGFKGLIFATISIFPQNIIILPALILGGTNGMVYSIKKFKNRFGGRKTYYRSNDFIGYCIITGVVLIALVLGSLMEAYISPVFIRFIIPIFE
jgi:stage II sporulation protein M